MKLLMMEGNTLAAQKKAAGVGVRSASEIYAEVIRTLQPDINIDTVNAAEGELVPPGRQYDEYDGLVISGSSLHAYDQTPEVLNQVRGLLEFAETGKPVLGSCWGLQVATVAAGGRVAPSPHGQELGVARKIQLTDAGRAHPFLAGKPAVHDAPCIHYDEVAELPAGATLLSYNRHSPAQAAIIPVGRSEFWGIQYHPEFDITHIKRLFILYQNELIKQGFVNSESEFHAHIDRYSILEENPGNSAIRWQLGIDDDILDINIRAVEIKNWLNHCSRHK